MGNIFSNLCTLHQIDPHGQCMSIGNMLVQFKLTFKDQRGFDQQYVKITYLHCTQWFTYKSLHGILHGRMWSFFCVVGIVFRTWHRFSDHIIQTTFQINPKKGVSFYINDHQPCSMSLSNDTLIHVKTTLKVLEYC